VKILDEQIASLDVRRREGRFERQVARLREAFPAHDVATIERRVAELSPDARELGIASELDEQRFLALSFLPEVVLSANAHVIARVLSDTEASASARLDFLERHFGPLR
jgi:hypothetical protein